MFFTILIACNAAAFLAGRHGDTAVRDPATLLLLVGWLALIAVTLARHHRDTENARAAGRNEIGPL